MKRRLFSLLAMTAMLISLLIGCTKPVVLENPAAEQKQGTPVSAQTAEDIALAHAGFSREEVTRLHTEKDYDDGVYRYEVQFKKDRLEYEYEIHAETGRILSFDKDYD